MNTYFSIEESPFYKGKYTICPTQAFYDLFEHGARGSFNVFIARLTGLTYTDFLRYSRDCLGAELMGKGCKYICPYYNKDENIYKLLGILNENMNMVVNKRKENGE